MSKISVANRNVPKKDKHVNKRPLSKRLIYSDVLDVKNNRELWRENNKNHGHPERYQDIYVKQLKNGVLDFILNDLQKHPDIMVLGPADGHDTVELKVQLEKYGIKPKLDVINFYKDTLNKQYLQNKSIRTDFSQNKAFEKLNFIDDISLINEIFEKYHLVIAPKSMGYYTSSESFTLYQSALLLQKGGRAYIEINHDTPDYKILTTKDLSPIAQNGFSLSDYIDRNYKLNLPEKIIKKINTQLIVAKRMLQAFARAHNLDREYKFRIVPESIETGSCRYYPGANDISVGSLNLFIQIDRIK